MELLFHILQDDPIIYKLNKTTLNIFGNLKITKLGLIFSKC